MELNDKRIFLATLLIFVVFLSGCELLMLANWNDTKSLEEYGDQVAETLAVLRTYIGKHKDEIRIEFGEPHKIDKRDGSRAVLNQSERVKFDEVWGYAYMKGIPMINAASSRKWFYFKDGIVVSVGAS